MDTVLSIINENWRWFGPLFLLAVSVGLVYVIKDIFTMD